MAKSSRPLSVTLLLALGIIAVALCLRSPIITISPLLDTIQNDLGASATVMGLLSTTPVICFGLVSNLAPQLARRWGLDRTIVGFVALLGVGIVVRSLPTVAALFGGAVIVGSAIAIGNVLMPALVKRDFPHNTSLMTSIYVMAISTGGAMGAGLTVPIMHRFDFSWRQTLAIWLIPVGIALAVLVPQVLRKRGTAAPRIETPRLRLWGDWLAWQVSFYMGMQSFMFYAVASWIPTMLIDGGMSESQAGVMLSLMNVIGLFASFAAPILAQKGPDQRWLVTAVMIIWAIAMVGLVIEPTTLTVVWMVLFGLASGASLSLALSLLVLRSPDTPHAATLSGMAQSVGYMIAATGPFMVGALHDLFGGWHIPMAVAALFLIPTLLAGLGAGRKRFVGQGAPGNLQPTALN